MTDNYADRMTLGLAFLDDTVPDWANQVCASALVMTSTTQCVLSQVFGRPDHRGDFYFSEAIAHAWEVGNVNEDLYPNPYDWAVDHGFDDVTSEANDLWLEVITA